MYPSRASLIEPHMYVPLGTRIQSWPWLYIWALLGARNEWQETPSRSARTVANINRKYCRQGISYLPDRSIFQLFRRLRSRGLGGLRNPAAPVPSGARVLFPENRSSVVPPLALCRQKPSARARAAPAVASDFRDGKEGTRTCRIRTRAACAKKITRACMRVPCANDLQHIARFFENAATLGRPYPDRRCCGVLIFYSLPKSSRRTQGSSVVLDHSCPTSRRTKYKYSVSRSPLFR
jgi:hypothetical protein